MTRPPHLSDSSHPREPGRRAGAPSTRRPSPESPLCLPRPAGPEDRNGRPAGLRGRGRAGGAGPAKAAACSTRHSVRKYGNDERVAVRGPGNRGSPPGPHDGVGEPATAPGGRRPDPEGGGPGPVGVEGQELPVGRPARAPVAAGSFRQVLRFPARGAGHPDVASQAETSRRPCGCSGGNADRALRAPGAGHTPCTRRGVRPERGGSRCRGPSTVPRGPTRRGAARASRRRRVPATREGRAPKSRRGGANRETSVPGLSRLCAVGRLRLRRFA